MNKIVNFFKYFFTKKYSYNYKTNTIHIKKCHKIIVRDKYVCITYFGFKKYIYEKYSEIHIGSESEVTKFDIDIHYSEKHGAFRFTLTNCIVGNFSCRVYERGFFGIDILSSTIDYMFLRSIYIDYAYKVDIDNSNIGYLNTDGIEIMRTKNSITSFINTLYMHRLILCVDKANIKVDNLYINSGVLCRGGN